MSTEDGDPPGGSSKPPADAAPTVASTVDAPLVPEPPPAVASATDDAILPASYDAGALDDAVGVRRRKKAKPPADEPVDDDGLPDDARRRRKTIIIAGLALVGGLGIAALVLFGRVNAQRYVLTCTTTHAIAEQGRSFPPWGTTPMPGAEWKPIPLPASAQCKPQAVDDRAQLEALYLDLLVERTSALLTMPGLIDAGPVAIDGKQVGTPLDLVSMQLEQALLLSRAPERGEQRKQIERMQGDVQYWRATLRLREASAALAEASRQFDQAALARPLHVVDAGAWAEFLRRLTENLQAGPGGVPAVAPTVGAPSPPSVGTGAPAGTALPVEPPPSAASGGDDAPATKPEASVPTGGVLL